MTQPLPRIYTLVELDFDGDVRTPRWAPDGRQLVFVSNSELYLFPDALAFARSGGDEDPPIVRLETSGSALFPEWSPDGRHVAYQVEEAGLTWAIEVIPLAARGRGPAGPPAIVNRGLSGASAFRPSWSPEGDRVAFYVDRGGSNESPSQSMDIGLARVNVNPNNGQIFRGEVERGRSGRIAEDVIPNDNRGPAWTLLDDGSTGSPAIVFVQRDESENHPIFVAAVQRWLDMAAPRDYLIPLSERGGWGTVNHKFVTSTLDHRRGMIRYAYASQEAGGEAVQVRDVVASFLPSIATTDGIATTDAKGVVFFALKGAALALWLYSVIDSVIDGAR